MSALLVYMRRIIGEEAANATAARNILAGVAGELSANDDGDLHRRCVLFDCAPSRVRADAVCAALAPSGGGAIEAVALCGYLVAAVVVFRTAAAAESALRRAPARRSCHAVPPLDVGIEIPGFGPTEVKMMPDSADPPEPCAPPPPPPEEEEPLPWFEFRDPWAEANGPVLPRGTRRFDPSVESLVHGPTRGADGSLWMHGDTSIIDERGRELGDKQGVSIRVKRTDPPPRHKRRPGIPDTAIWFMPF